MQGYILEILYLKPILDNEIEDGDGPEGRLKKAITKGNGHEESVIGTAIGALNSF